MVVVYGQQYVGEKPTVILLLHTYPVYSVYIVLPINRGKHFQRSGPYFIVYIWSHIHITRVRMDQPGKLANPASGQLNSENKYFPVPVRA